MMKFVYRNRREDYCFHVFHRRGLPIGDSAGMATACGQIGGRDVFHDLRRKGLGT